MEYDEMRKFAIANYDKGGDFFVECWDKKDYDEYVKLYGKITKKKALEMFRMWEAVYRDRTNY